MGRGRKKLTPVSENGIKKQSYNVKPTAKKKSISVQESNQI